MKITKHKIVKSFAAFAFAGTLLAAGLAHAQENPGSPAAESDEAEILTRGPVHEAFAGTVSFDPVAGLIVDKQPPELIEEVPPEQQLEGENVTWIPGYWGWEEEQEDFLWISGIWRNLPPGRQWVPGYWAEVDRRYQWTSGYWEDETATEVAYLPEPPKSVEVGPNIDAPSENHNWIPGNWMWRNDRYAWSAGYWAPVRADWAWTPAYYRWSNRGYVYVNGFWDYPVARRGVVFAPIRFRSGFAFRPGYRYRPATVISLSVFSNHLFLRPNYGHYYFGDYYEPRYRDRGFYASYSYQGGRRGFDPIFAHYRWENRNVANWERGRRDYYEFRRDHVGSRPPRTWAALNARPVGDRERGDYGVAERFDRVVGNHGEGQQRFKAVDKQDQERYVTQTKEIRKFAQDRKQLETRDNKSGPDKDQKNAKVTSEKINRSPILAKKSDRSEKDGGPPDRLQTRASEKDEPGDRGDKADKADKPDNGDKQKDGPRRRDDNADKSNRKDTDGPSSDEKMKPNGEERTKPGQRRDSDSKTDKKNKDDSDKDSNAKPDKNSGSRDKSDTKNTPSTKPESTDKPSRKNTDDTPSSDQGKKRDKEPSPEQKDRPDRKTQADPNTGNREKSQPDPAPRKKPASEPAPTPRAKPEEKRTAPPATRPAPSEKRPQAEPRRAERKPENRVQPQVTPRPTTPPVSPQTRPRKNPDQPVPSTPGAPDEDNKTRRKRNE